MKPTLLVMAKAPLIGHGKSRLASELGLVEAWRINRTLQAHTLRTARDPRWTTVLCVAPTRAANLRLPGVWPAAIRRFPQGEGDLGERLERILAPLRNVAVIGTDCPDLKRHHIAAAFAALKCAPFVIGPAHDGGFWLLAARSGRAAARAMRPVRWSTPYAAKDVIRNLGADRVAKLHVMRDVDTAADLRASSWWRRSARSTSHLAFAGVRPE